MDRPCLEVAAHSCGLDVDDLTGTEGDRQRRRVQAGDRLVETDRDGQLLGQPRMSDQVAPRIGLLQQE